MEKRGETRRVKSIEHRIVHLKKCLIRGDLILAKKIYIGIIKLYKKLSEDEKPLVYTEILKLYRQRKRAEELHGPQKKKHPLKIVIDHTKVPAMLLAIAAFFYLLLHLMGRFSVFNNVTQDLSSGEILGLITFPIACFIILFLIVVLYSKHLREALVESWREYIIERLMPFITLLGGSFLVITVILMFIMKSIGNAFMSGGTEVADTALKAKTGVYMFAIISFIVILFIVLPKWLSHDVRLYTVKKMIKHEPIYKKARDALYRITHRKKKDDIHFEDAPMADTGKENIHEKFRRHSENLFAHAQKFKDFDEELHMIIKARELLAHEKVEKSKQMYQEINAREGALAEDKKQIIDMMLSYLEKEIENAEYIYK